MTVALVPRLHGADALPAALLAWRWMIAARRIDEVELELVQRGEAHFHVGGAGHEASAMLAPCLGPQDWLHLHYRDKALLLARGVPVRQFFDSLLGNAASHSGGRQMSAHFSAPELHVASIVGPVGNGALHAVGMAQQVGRGPGRPLVVCSLGDGSTQQGEVLEAIAEAVRDQLPVLFLVHDNRWAISTRTTGRTFFSLPDGPAASFMGVPLLRADGSRPHECAPVFRQAVARLREGQGPAICILATERLCDHTNADDETAYRSRGERERAAQLFDPVQNLERWLLGQGVEAGTLRALQIEVDSEVLAAAALALETPAPAAGEDLAIAGPRAAEHRGEPGTAALTMAEALRAALGAALGRDARVTLHGQDIEDPKGDVFGVTRGLSGRHPGRVLNAPLSESTIVGTAIGRALAGGRPVAMLQFADFVPLAFNQLASELATLQWRTRGGWRAPVVVMAPCGAYRPGLGPFHAQTFDSTLAHVPGLDVVVPATATDAAGALNAALQGERPTVLLYPKALLHSRREMAPADTVPLHVPVGTGRVLQAGTDITLLAWGNLVAPCLQAAQALQAAGVAAEVIDLRWLAPWDRTLVIDSVRRTRHLVVVHEDNLTVGFGAEVVATVAEALGTGVRCRRVARADTFVPCRFELQRDLLPSWRTVLDAAAGLLDLALRWEEPVAPAAAGRVVRVLGSSPTDETVRVVEIAVRAGQTVQAGETLASLEADKAVADVAAPQAGVVQQVLLEVGQQVSVGTPLLMLAGAPERSQAMAAASEPVPRFARPWRGTGAKPAAGIETVAITGLASACGSTRLDNDTLAAWLPSFGSAAGIFDRTGIETRAVCAAGESVEDLALDACRRALAQAGVRPEDLALLICSTSTPAQVAPSTACRLLGRLAPGVDVPAYDVQAACSGYLYALAQAWDRLAAGARGPVLVVTSEQMRRIVDPHDAQTSPLFGDATTATVVARSGGAAPELARLRRPLLGAQGDEGEVLQVPLPGPGAWVRMDGRRVFGEAVHRMGAVLGRACTAAGLAPQQLDLVVPHQANGRILEALRSRLRLQPAQVWNGIRGVGNTSSSSIPLALGEALQAHPQARRIGLCAFGAGFTFGAALLERG